MSVMLTEYRFKNYVMGAWVHGWESEDSDDSGKRKVADEMWDEAMEAEQ